ncbi:MAG: chemotaxis protein CheD [Actinomycetota bacterium]|nr:chemotaxis protein CheD [Actinomycetota bacterium]
MSEVTPVGVAEIRASKNSEILASYGLGSCVAVAIFDPMKKVGGLVHALLPESRGRDSGENPGKFADTGVASLVEKLIELGARRRFLRSKIVGGACMFEMPSGAWSSSGKDGRSFLSDIGRRNVEAAKQKLEELKIPLVAEDTGGNYGRTVKLNTETGDIEVNSLFHGSTHI